MEPDKSDAERRARASPKGNELAWARPAPGDFDWPPARRSIGQAPRQRRAARARATSNEQGARPSWPISFCYKQTILLAPRPRPRRRRPRRRPRPYGTFLSALVWLPPGARATRALGARKWTCASGLAAPYRQSNSTPAAKMAGAYTRAGLTAPPRCLAARRLRHVGAQPARRRRRRRLFSQLDRFICSPSARTAANVKSAAPRQICSPAPHEVLASSWPAGGPQSCLVCSSSNGPCE